MTCPGCHKDDFSTFADFEHHIVSCACRQGFNASRKHTVIKRFFRNLVEQSALGFVNEPRLNENFKCIKCKARLDTSQVERHDLNCNGALIRSGPDFIIQWPWKATWYDVTGIQDASEERLTISASFADLCRSRMRVKEGKYKEQIVTRGDSFITLCFSVLGALHADTVNLIHQLADELGLDRRDALTDFACVLQASNAKALPSWGS